MSKSELEFHVVHVKRQRIIIEEVSLTAFNEVQRDVPDNTYDPYEVLRQRTLMVAEGLGVTEAEAERMVLGKVLA
jgi:hypothetical protein